MPHRVGGCDTDCIRLALLPLLAARRSPFAGRQAADCPGIWLLYSLMQRGGIPSRSDTRHIAFCWPQAAPSRVACHIPFAKSLRGAPATLFALEQVRAIL